MLKYKVYLDDIEIMIEAIEKTMKGKSYVDFISDINLLDATSMRFQVLGECIKNLPRKITNKYKNIDWKRFLDTRNIVSHVYHAVNYKILFSMIKHDIPKLKKFIKKEQIK